MLNLVTELEIHTSDGGCVNLDVRSDNFLVMYNNSAERGLVSACDIALGELYMDLSCGEVFALIVSNIEVTDEDGDVIGTRDIAIFGSYITSIFATTEAVLT
jgi:hypothetical protein